MNRAPARNAARRLRAPTLIALCMSVASPGVAQSPAAAPAAKSPAVPVQAAPGTRLSYSKSGVSRSARAATPPAPYVFRLTRRDGTPQEVRIPIKDGNSENRVDRRLSDGFERQLDRKTYSIEGDDGEDVLLNERLG